jgi:hypothetical protein
MKDRILQAIFSLSGASLAIGFAGFLSALVTMFVDVTDQISVKWLLFIILIFSILMLILLKVIFDLSSESHPSSPFEIPIKFIEGEQLFVIRRNDNFLNNIVVGCYLQRDDIDCLAYIGFVYLVQDKVIQIKVYRDLGIAQSAPTSSESLKNIVIRSVVPVTALECYTHQENTHEW